MSGAPVPETAMPAPDPAARAPWWVRLPWPLLLLVAAGAALRTVRLGSLPPALFRDEAEKAMTAWSLLTMGTDLAGHRWPLFIQVFGVTTSAIYQYAAIPFIALFGPNEWGARMPAACAGIATLLVNHAWMRRERGRDIAFWATAFLVMSPWHVFFSRWAQQGIFLPLWLSAAMWGWRAFLDRRRWGLPAAALFAGLAVYSYEVARLFVPLLGLWIAVLYWRPLAGRWRETLAAAIVGAAAVAPVVHLLLASPDAAQARFRAISVWQPGMGFGGAAGEFLRNYLSHFTPQFLLLFGDGELRHSAGVGVVTAAEFLAIASWAVHAVKRRKREDLVWLGWLLLFPVAASLTRVGVPHALRCIVVLPILQNMAGDGLWRFLQRFRGTFAEAARHTAMLFVIIGFVPFAASYFITYSTRSAFNWQYGVKQALEELEPLRGRLDRVFFHKVTGAEYLVAYYARVQPRQIRESGLTRTPYSVLPFDLPPDSVFADRPGANAVVTFPFLNPPPGGSMIPVYPPRSNQPVLAVYLDAEATRRAGIRK